jgi:hypothetical protein
MSDIGYVLTCVGCGEEFSPNPSDAHGQETSQEFAFILWKHAAMVTLGGGDHDVLFTIRWDE